MIKAITIPAMPPPDIAVGEEIWFAGVGSVAENWEVIFFKKSKLLESINLETCRTDAQ